MPNGFLWSFYGFGAVAIGYGLYSLYLFLHYRDFPCTDAIILGTGVTYQSGDEGLSHRAEIEFSYSIGGKNYISRKLCSLGDLAFGGATSRQKVERVIACFPAGSTVRVFYDPRTPAFAFIRNGPVLQIVAPILIGSLLAGCGLLLQLKMRA